MQAMDVLDYTYSKCSAQSQGFAAHTLKKLFVLVERDLAERSQHTSSDPNRYSSLGFGV